MVHRLTACLRRALNDPVPVGEGGWSCTGFGDLAAPQGKHGTAMHSRRGAPMAIETTSEHAYRRISMGADNALNSALCR
jgi:hypothetical protein